MNYTFSGKTKTLTFVLMAIGIVAIAYGFLMHPDRAWSNLLLNAFFFTAIAVAGTFFIAVNYVGEAGWHTGFKRVPEAMGTYLPIGALVLTFVMVAGLFHWHHIYHWMDPEFQATDEIYNSSLKKSYLSNGFFIARTIVYLGGWIILTRWFRKISLSEDTIGGLENYKKGIKAGATFLVFFAVTSSMSAWDWLMSIDVHWYSTLFGWYIFAGLFVSGITMMMLLVIHLKRNGLLPNVNENHIHDIAKFMFAFSIFWTYLWFSQYMLIWYSNIPEEINYFLERFRSDYKPIIISMLIINFVFPLIVLMHRNAKRTYGLLTVAGIIILFGHWLDLFQIIMPGSVKDAWGIGLTEIGMFVGFLGLFLFVTLTSLAKYPLVAKNHPFLNESKQHHI